MIATITIIATAIAILTGLYVYTRLAVRRAEQQYPPKGQFVTVEGIRLHYLKKGDGKQPVVFLHGGILSAHDFDRVLDLAAGEGEYEAYSFDRPGYGYSERPRGERITPIDQARLLHEALRQLGVRKPILVGHSWSGLPVLAYALHYPEDTAGIVLVGAAGYGGKLYPAGDGDPLSKLVATPVVGDLFTATLLRPLGALAMESMVRQTFAPDPVPPGYTEAAQALWLRPAQFKANREDIIAFSPAAYQLSGRYGDIGVPTVIVVGELDPFISKRHSFLFHETIPNSKLTVLPHAAHMIPQAHPEAVLEAIKQVSEET
ncbi:MULTISPECIES: alpha/beta fold hydrolase [unclassified Paenibacillus]|uniref:alpha/beta fold hydrolase n=1 Tax=unclassified Paenibacillus TaxID=185978 RepID=UPI001C11969C|nr:MULTISPECIES: alpha/beta hydrolase [unclassified Paenibacillus]MBU5442021.1 alpha/beta hydrolase [Paenibacillus sp. MSJ-34]CAH0120453.1 2-hydroxy-6-oxononadienedioate/2-hydroxy-6-oxononatrienedioate hydrolase [Paenibacillus sp. CECT 9249]